MKVYFKCFTCDSDSLQGCYETGETLPCVSPNVHPHVCQSEVRRRDGVTYKVIMRCKAVDACLEQKVSFPMAAVKSSNRSSKSIQEIPNRRGFWTRH